MGFALKGKGFKGASTFGAKGASTFKGKGAPTFGAKGGGFGGKGFSAFGGKSKGKSFISPIQNSFGKGFGKSYGKGFGKGKGKGKTQLSGPPNCKVWIGGLPESDAADREMNKALQEHMKQAGNCKFVSIGKSGQGGAAFSTPEEAMNAITELNGSEFQGHLLEVDTWTKKDGSSYD